MYLLRWLGCGICLGLRLLPSLSLRAPFGSDHWTGCPTFRESQAFASADGHVLAGPGARRLPFTLLQTAQSQEAVHNAKLVPV